MKRLKTLFTVLLLICSVGMPVLAHEVPDQTRKGSIEITMHTDETTVGGGTLTLYRVGDVNESDGNYAFVLTEDFEESGESLENIGSAELANHLAAYAEEKTLEGLTQAIDDNGNVSFTELELGLYLLVQEEAAEGYNKLNPFVVSVPQMKEGAYVYEVDASPKVELTPAPTPPLNDPDEPDVPEEPDEPDEPKLPQTGQLNWPIPVLTVAGLTLLALGWLLCSGCKKERKTK